MHTDEPVFEGFTFAGRSHDVRAYTLDSNGLMVLLMPQRLAPVATFMITYRVGSRNERTGETGATHFLEHMMFKGTVNHNKETGGTVFQRLQSLGAQVNATTWNDRTNYYGMLPAEHLHEAVAIEADRMRGLRLHPDDVASEKTVILNEFDRGENEPYRKLYHAVWSAAYEAHTYHHPTIGWRSDIEDTTSDSLRSFYDRFYWPDNATVSVIGGFDETAIMACIRKEFGLIPGAPYPIPDVAVREPEQRGERRLTIRMAGDIPAILMAWKAPSALDASTMGLQLASMVLSHGRTSRLYGRLVQSGLCTSVGASMSSFRDPGLFTVFALTRPETDPDAVELLIRDEMRTMATTVITEEEHQRALAALEADTAFSRDGSFGTASALNEAIAAGDWTLFTTFLERAKATSRDDIMSAVASIFNDDRQTTGRFIPVEAAAPAP